MVSPRAGLSLDGACAPCRGVLRFEATSFNRPRTLTVSENGRPVFKRRIDRPTRVAIPLSFDRHASIDFAGAPGPEPIRAVMPDSADPRSISVNIANLRFGSR
jgi:hypothetical protein